MATAAARPAKVPPGFERQEINVNGANVVLFVGGTGEPLLTGRQLRPATHTVHVGDGASRLKLPAGGLPSRH